MNYKVICHSEYCDFVCFTGTKKECEEYVSQHSNEYLQPVEMVADVIQGELF